MLEKTCPELNEFKTEYSLKITYYFTQITSYIQSIFKLQNNSWFGLQFEIGK